MTHITLSNSIRTQLGSLSLPLALCDEAGNLLGTFTPAAALTEHQRIALTLPHDHLYPEIPAEELQSAIREEGRIPHDEVVRKAKKFQ
jgi:hypothetical protein